MSNNFGQQNVLSRKWIFDNKNVFIVCDLEGKSNEWIRLFKGALKGHQTLFIIDDCSAEGEINKRRDALSELAFSGHHRNHSLWVLTQKYNSVSKDVREQIKRVSCMKQTTLTQSGAPGHVIGWTNFSH